MEQLTLELDESERTNRELIHDALKKEIDNPEYSQYLTVTTNKDNTISIKAKSYLAAKIKLHGKVRYIEIPSRHIENIPDGYISNVNTEAKNDVVRLPVSSISDVLSLRRILGIIYVLVLSELGGESFGCCSRYVQCSDEKKCVNPDIMMSFACAYKKNLEAGKIFYGKNKNI